MTIKFPQINRKLTAFLLILVLAPMGLANLMQNLIFEKNDEKKLRFEVMRYPYISVLHEKLGSYYLGINNEAAQREYILAQSSRVLGAQNSPWQTWQDILKIQNSQDLEIKYWEKVLLSYPDYTYASLKLAVLNLQKGNSEKARNYLSLMIAKNPTDETAKKLVERLK